MTWHKGTGASVPHVSVPKPVMPHKQASQKAPGVKKVIGTTQVTPDIAKAGKIKKASKK